jgi:hypothetical protein
MPSAVAYAFSVCALLANGVWLAGCDMLVGFDDLPSVTTPTIKQQCFADEPQSEEPRASVTLRVPFTENVGMAVAEALQIRACPLLDPACETPLAWGVTDAAGVAELVVPTNLPKGEFLGFFLLDQPGYFKSSTLFRPPPKVDLTLPAAVAVSDRVVDVLSTVLGFTRATFNDRAHLAVLPVTCGRTPVAGIEPILPTNLDLLDASSVALVRSDGNPLPGESVTTSDGVVVFVNLRLPEGQDGLPITLTLFDWSTQKEFVPPQVVPLRRGELTTLVVAPAP